MCQKLLFEYNGEVRNITPVTLYLWQGQPQDLNLCEQRNTLVFTLYLWQPQDFNLCKQRTRPSKMMRNSAAW